jgi:tyrosyl-tRNA synthetase
MTVIFAEADAIIDELQWRGLFFACTDEKRLRELLRESKKPLTVYCGFDPTATSLHVGSLVPLLTLARLQRGGLRVIALAGGATGLVGDPSGKRAERTLLTEEIVRKNVEGVAGQLRRLLDFESEENPAILVNNLDWTAPMSVIEFLRDIGKHFSVNMMMQKDAIKDRLNDPDKGISYTEFSYMLLQSLDFLHLHRTQECVLQIGGSDQWGNIVTGVDLIRRVNGAETFGLTVPLLTKADGTKFGKSEGGENIWLDPEMTSPYQFYQFWIRADDRDVPKFLKLFTFLDRQTIGELERSTELEPEKRLAQQHLAFEVTRLVHGTRAAESAVKASHVLFGGDPTDLGEDDWRMLEREIPTTLVSAEELANGIELADLLLRAGAAPSKGQARKDIKAGGVYANNERIADEKASITSARVLGERHILLRKGKKNYYLVIVEAPNEA